MTYLKLFKRVTLCSVLVVLCAGMAMPASAVTVTSQIDAAPSTSGERYLRGEFIRLTEGRKLVTSVGTFDIPANAEVIDHREKSDEVPASAVQVVLKFRNDYLIEVTIY
ncbi:hypothetical protein FE848_15695 [Marinobacter sp. 1-3A]|uniref:hypothetical protein n=1 Tax=Marinobacter sp. 1-3A TaxID=2582920 RepID=UPI0019055AD0|nr:hypothetical protein [Marinobacter sp. 1-3A]MBK1874667.1 hypothetical protein [Marinobacter sp. 1-3A]